MDDKRLKSILFYALTGIMFAILLLLVFYNDYNYGMAALAIYTLIIILVTSAVWISIFYWYIVRNKVNG
jgi:predicted neutral ceramidase superfamily lipid hydrolase